MIFLTILSLKNYHLLIENKIDLKVIFIFVDNNIKFEINI
jgi:hypothetical protein